MMRATAALALLAALTACGSADPTAVEAPSTDENTALANATAMIEDVPSDGLTVSENAALATESNAAF